MNRSRIIAVAYKEWREIVRDRLFFALAFVVPTLLMVLFGYGLSLDVENIPLSIIDYDRSALSREYAHRFTDSRYFNFLGYLHDEREIKPRLTDNEIRAVIIIPEHFAENLLGGRPATVQTLVDGTFPFRTQTTRGYVQAINAAFSLQTLSAWLQQTRGLSPADTQRLLQPVRIETRYRYNEGVKSIWALAPKLMMLVLMLSPPFLTALGVVREKESGSIFNIYASTVSRGEFLIGKLTPYVGISLVNAFILWLMACFAFGAPFRGNPLFFLLAASLYVACTTGIGLVVSAAVNTQVAAMVVTVILTVVPAVLYSGLFIPIPSLSSVAQVVAHALPGMYFADIATGTFLKGAGLLELWPNVLALAAYASGLFTIGFLLFHKRNAS